MGASGDARVTRDERQAALDEIANEVRACTRYDLAEGRTRAVPGEGDPDTEVVFVGEGPGFNEDREGRPSSAAPAACSCASWTAWAGSATTCSSPTS